MNIKEFKPYLFTGDISDYVSPPFDTITVEQEKKLRSSKFNITALSLPEYRNNGMSQEKLIQKWIAENVIYQYNKDIIIILKQVFYINKEATTRYGIISLTEIDSMLKVHENTFEKQVMERKTVMRELNGEPEPIFIVVPNNGFDKIVRRYANSLEERFKFEEPSGVENHVYFLEDPDKIAKLREAVRNDQGIVADGHHRTQAIKDIKQETGDSFWNYAMSYITSIYDNGLMIGGVDRLVYRINFEENLPKIRNLFDVTVERAIVEDNDLRVYSKGVFYRLVPKKFVIDETFGTKYPISTEIINQILFVDALGINKNDIETKVGYIYNTTDAINAVDMHECDFAIIIPPWQKDVFLKMTLEGVIFPQKSTYFYPKIPSGIAIYLKPS
ncbi:MAG: hypothetical protein AMDU4_FER2C00057G0039 [Ferroplasma sp. Type II]|jgi:uncharacterized protein (DUF1015 family)|uniref:DUF1015 family protein n=1 Tax=Ferroplasma sp. Type II TaxID=261388 RepID=UPI00038958D0|nr:DUF1015 family protein [Ferroplasma sp. Type II]EQB73568.1 MAG: hypothetical protein AMDU4_FER2C00057G0039 [Ferroplasma sp. Type II]HIH59673.1 DUF1015 family protein [Ferroplasma sp.]HII82605.1 DUF1015 family protein [Ferroplasma sp.]